MAKTAAAVAVFFLLFGIAGRMDKEDAIRQENAPVQVPQEDELFWDCTTQGNYTCGEPITNWPNP